MKNIFKTVAIIVVLFFGLCLFVLSIHIGGWRVFIVKSGSMEPTIHTGSMVISRYTHPSLLKTHDIITFVGPTKEREFITHRITKITDTNEYISIKTKGDKNNAEDVWDVPGGSVVGKVLAVIPYIGYVLAFAQSKIGILLFILIPSIFILVEEVSFIISVLRKKHTDHLKGSTFLMIMLLVGTFLSPQPTYSLLSDSALISGNRFTVTAGKNLPRTTVTPTMKPTITPTPIQACKDGNEDTNDEDDQGEDEQ